MNLRCNSNEEMAPTKEIDRVWHLHMLSPEHYYEDCLKSKGKLIYHNSSVSGDRLNHAFNRTKEKWLEIYKEKLNGEAAFCD